MHEGRGVHLGLARAHQLHETRVQPVVFAGRRHAVCDAIDVQLGTALAQHQRSLRGLHRDVPALVAGLQEIEFRSHRYVVGIGEGKRGRQRRLPITRCVQRGFAQRERPRQQMGDDGQRIDAGVEHAHATVLQDPVLAGVPMADVFLPGDVHAHQLLAGQPLPCRLHAGRATRVPAGEQAALRLPGDHAQVVDLRQGGRRWFFQEHMAPGRQRRLRQGMPPHRGCAQGHRLDLRMRGKRLLQRLERWHTIHRAMPAHGGHQLHVVARGDGGHVLVAGDLADTDKGNAQCVWMLHRNLRAHEEVTAHR